MNPPAHKLDSLKPRPLFFTCLICLLAHLHLTTFSWSQEEQQLTPEQQQRQLAQTKAAAQAIEEEYRAKLTKLWQLPAEIPSVIEPKQPSKEDLLQAIEQRQEALQAAAESEDAPEPSPQLGIGEFLAIGQESLDVIFFSYALKKSNGFVDGQTRGIFSAQEVLRADEHQLDIKQLEAELFGKEPGSPTTWVSVEQGNWYLPMNLLLSESRTEIRRSNLRIVGEGCRYSSNDEVMEIYGKTYTEFYRIPAQSSQDPLDPRSPINQVKPASAPLTPVNPTDSPAS